MRSIHLNAHGKSNSKATRRTFFRGSKEFVVTKALRSELLTKLLSRFSSRNEFFTIVEVRV